MHFHLPKPLHGWRAFAGEVGIIVLGVLIALGAEQVVEAIHWRDGVSQMREAMRSELAIDRKRVEVNLAQGACIDARLDAILRWSASAPSGARIANAHGPLLWNYHTSTWDITKTSPTAGQFSLKEQLMYAGDRQAHITSNAINYLKRGAAIGVRPIWNDFSADDPTICKPILSPVPRDGR